MKNAHDDQLPDRNSVLEAFKVLDRMQTENEGVISGNPDLELENTFLNKMRVGMSPGATDRFVQGGKNVMAIMAAQIQIMKDTIWPMIDSDIRNQPAIVSAFDSALDAKTFAQQVRGMAKVIDLMKHMLRV